MTMKNNPANLPYEGRIRRRDYDLILPQHRMTISDEAAFREILAEQVGGGDFSLCPAAEMTIGRCIHAWATAFRGQFSSHTKAVARESARTDEDLNENGTMECGPATREQYDRLVEAIEWGPEK